MQTEPRTNERIVSNIESLAAKAVGEWVAEMRSMGVERSQLVGQTNGVYKVRVDFRGHLKAPFDPLTENEYQATLDRINEDGSVNISVRSPNSSP